MRALKERNSEERERMERFYRRLSVLVWVTHRVGWREQERGCEASSLDDLMGRGVMGSLTE